MSAHATAERDMEPPSASIDLVDEHGEAPRWLSVVEVAKLAGVTTGLVCSWARNGTLIGSRDGWQWQFSQEAVTALLAERARAGLPRKRSSEPSAFETVLMSALEREGLTISAAAVAIGVHPATIGTWRLGSSTPYRDSLERLAEVVKEPSLLGLIESHRRWIKLTCRKCGESRKEQAGVVRGFEKERDPIRFSVDWERGEATHICNRCAAQDRITARSQSIVKRRGRKGLSEILGKPLRDWRAANPEAAAKQHRRAVTAAKQHRPQYDERGKVRRRLGLLKLNPSGTIALCALCHHLLFVPTANARSQRARGGQVVGSFHGPCYTKWQATRIYRDWVSARIEARRLEQPIPPMPMPMAPTGSTTSEEWLTAAYKTTLRLLWQHEGNRRAVRQDGKLLSVVQLAEVIGVPHRTIYAHARRFIELLPDEEIATGVVKTWREVLLPLWADIDARADELRARTRRGKLAQTAQT